MNFFMEIAKASLFFVNADFVAKNLCGLTT